MFVITQLHPFGGAQQFLLRLLENIDLARFEPIVAGGVAEKSRLEQFCRAQNIPLKPLKSLVRSISPSNDYRAYKEILALVKAEKPDTLFLLSSKAGFLGSLAAWQVRGQTRKKSTRTDAEKNPSLHPLPYTLSPKVIYRIGGWAFNDPRSWLSKQLYILAEKISAKWKDVIIVNSKHDADQAGKLGIYPRGKLVTIYNGLNCAELQYLTPQEAREYFAWRSNFQIPISKFQWIGCVANFYKTKGLPILIEAMANVHKTKPDAKLIIVGDGMEREYLEFEIKKAELSETIFLPGHLENAQQYLKAFDVFVLPSLKEGFPWALIEAMAAEVPVVATRVGAIPEIIYNGKNGLMVEPGDSTALADAIKKILGDGKLRSEFAMRGKEIVEQKFRLDSMIKEVIALLG